VDARLREAPAQDLVLDVVEADGAAARHVAAALEELPVARAPDRRDGILGDDRVQRERVVGVDPVGEALVVARKAVAWVSGLAAASEAMKSSSRARRETSRS
jgi:hypothetical protein